MKITLIAHAFSIFETDRTVLYMDPIFSDLFEDGHTTHYPARKIHFQNLPLPDAIFLSHRHGDHFDEDSLKKLVPAQPTIVFLESLSIEEDLKQLGFKNLKKLKPFEMLQYQDIELFLTPSLARWNEAGISIKYQNHWLWNQVDTSVDHSIVEKTQKLMEGNPTIHLCPYQPMMEQSINWVNETSKPVERFQRLAEMAIATNSRYLVPASAGVRHQNSDSWVNSRAFPYEESEFTHLLNQASFSGKICQLLPGQQLVVKNNDYRKEQSNYAELRGDDDNLTKFAPLKNGPLPQDPWYQIEEETKLLNEVVDQVEVILERLRTTPTLELSQQWKTLRSRRALIKLTILLRDSEIHFSLKPHEHFSIARVENPDFQYEFSYRLSQLHQALVENFDTSDLFFMAKTGIVENHPFNTLSPWRLSGIDEYFVVDGSLHWHPLRTHED